MLEWTSYMIDLDFFPALLVKTTAVLSAAWLIHFALRMRNPRWRVLLWRGVLAALILLPVAQWWLPATDLEMAIEPEPMIVRDMPLSTHVEPSIGDIQTPPTPALSSATKSVVVESPPSLETPAPTFEVGAWLWIGIWALGFAFMLFRLGIAWTRLRGYIAHTSDAPAEISALAHAIAGQLTVNSCPGVRTIGRDGSPFLAGLWRSIIVLPERCVRRDNASRLPAILAHELAHAKSRDVAWMAVARVVSSVLWFHPLMWRLRNAHSTACEEVCDGVAADYVGGASAYAKTLAQEALAVQGMNQLEAGVPMIRRTEIIDRLRRIERGIRANPIARKWVAASAIAGVCTLLVLGSLRLVAAQSKDVEEKYPHIISIQTYETSWSAFEPGDSIDIEEVRGTQPDFAEGEEYYVRGTYTLASRDRASIHAYATNGEVESDQGPPVEKGSGEFVRTFMLTKNGMLHVSYYPAEGGNGFGNRYYRRSTKEAKAIPGEPLPAIEIDVSNEDAIVRLPGVDASLVAAVLPTGELLSPRGTPIDLESLENIWSLPSNLDGNELGEEFFRGFPKRGSMGPHNTVISVDSRVNPENGLGLVFQLEATEDTGRQFVHRPTLRDVQLDETDSKSPPYIALRSSRELFRYYWDDVISEDRLVSVRTDISLGTPLDHIADIPRDARGWEFEFDNRTLVATIEREPDEWPGRLDGQIGEAYHVTLKLVDGEPLPNCQIVGIEYDGPTVTSVSDIRSSLNPGEEWTWRFRDYVAAPIAEIARFQLIGHQLQPIIWRNVALTAQETNGGDTTAAASDILAPPPIEIDASKGGSIVRLPDVNLKLLATLPAPEELLNLQGAPIAPETLGSGAASMIERYRNAPRTPNNPLGLLFHVEAVEGSREVMHQPFVRDLQLQGSGSDSIFNSRIHSWFIENGESEDSAFHLCVFGDSPSPAAHMNLRTDVFFGPPAKYAADLPLKGRNLEIDIDNRTLVATVERLSDPRRGEAYHVTVQLDDGKPLPDCRVEAVESDGRLVRSTLSTRNGLNPGEAKTWTFRDSRYTPIDKFARFKFVARHLQSINWHNVSLVAQAAPKDGSV